MEDFDTFGFGLTWGQWFTVHETGTVVLFLLGTYFGYRQGKYWYKRLYGATLVKKTTL